MAEEYSYKKFFQNLYSNMGQEYGFQAQTAEESRRWQREFRQALKEALGLDLLEEIAAQWKQSDGRRDKQPEKESEKQLESGAGTGESDFWQAERWERAEQPGQAWQAEQRACAEQAGQQWQPGQRACAGQRGQAWQAVQRAYAEQRGQAWQPGQRECAQQLERVEEEGYTRYKFRMETLPQVYMPFYMLVPEGVSAEKPARAVIAVPAHGANKDTVAGVPANRAVQEKLLRSPKEAYGLALVKRGYVALCPDPPGYGERIEPLPTEAKAFAQPSRKSQDGEDAPQPDPLGCSCKDLAQTAEAFGLSLTALEIWDLMRLTDFAAGQREIDGKRIGCAGFSGGGQYAMWLAAMDDRIRAAVVSGYVHGYYDSILDVHLCPCNYAPKLWRLGDISDICSLIAPRPLFVENGLNDPLNGYRGIAGPKEQVDRIRKAYRLYGQEEKLVHVTPEGGHQWYGECYDFLDQVL